MSQEIQGHSASHNRTTKVELQPRTATQAMTVPEGPNDAISLEHSQADIGHGQLFASQCSALERPRSLKQSSDQDSDTPVQEMGSTNQHVQLNSVRASMFEDDQTEAGGAVMAQPHTSQNCIRENERLSPQVESALLDGIRDEMLFRLGVTARGTRDILMHNIATATMRFQFGSGDDETVELYGDRLPRTEKRFEAARVYWAICNAWPKNRHILWVRQDIVESDGHGPAIQVPWSSAQELYQDELKVGDQDPISVPLSGNADYESLWHSWCFAAIRKLHELWEQEIYMDMDSLNQPRGKIAYCTSNGRRKGVRYFPINVFAYALSYDEPFSKPRNDHNSFRVGYAASFFSPNFRGKCHIVSDSIEDLAIHWQMRYFRPANWSTDRTRNCLLSKRQTATIHRRSEAICLEETRARISFRVSRWSPGLFSIFILTDEPMAEGTYTTNRIEDAIASWERYGLKVKERTIPITHYLFKVCRVFEECMDAWGETLDAIDSLVHVNLDDFDDQSRVEDLMFDKSFDRSKDYFVALQLLRIVDEWLDEVVPSVKELQKNPSLRYPAFFAAEAEENFNAAIRSIDERAAAVQQRVRKKVEEINSLRDGLFNATSLRESTKAMALNQAIYVFTVVTVLFTPVSFLATFWALPFLNNPTEGTDIVPVPSAFRNSFIIMPLLTYALVIGVAWFVGQRNSVDTLLSMLKKVGESKGQLLKSGRDLLRKKLGKGEGSSPYA